MVSQNLFLPFTVSTRDSNNVSTRNAHHKKHARKFICKGYERWNLLKTCKNPTGQFGRQHFPLSLEPRAGAPPSFSWISFCSSPARDILSYPKAEVPLVSVWKGASWPEVDCREQGRTSVPWPGLGWVEGPWCLQDNIAGGYRLSQVTRVSRVLRRRGGSGPM